MNGILMDFTGILMYFTGILMDSNDFKTWKKCKKKQGKHMENQKATLQNWKKTEAK